MVRLLGSSVVHQQQQAGTRARVSELVSKAPLLAWRLGGVAYPSRWGRAANASALHPSVSLPPVRLFASLVVWLLPPFRARLTGWLVRGVTRSHVQPKQRACEAATGVTTSPVRSRSIHSLPGRPSLVVARRADAARGRLHELVREAGTRSVTERRTEHTRGTKREQNDNTQNHAPSC